VPSSIPSKMLIITQKWLKFERSPAGLPIGWGKQKIKKTGNSVQKKGIWQNYNNILEFNAKFGNFYQKAF